MDMKEITWTQAFLGSKGLKDLRIENSLEVPEWYRKSTWRLAIAILIHGMVIGVLFSGLAVYVIGLI